jgi:hypothetical protein
MIHYLIRGNRYIIPSKVNRISKKQRRARIKLLKVSPPTKLVRGLSDRPGYVGSFDDGRTELRLELWPGVVEKPDGPKDHKPSERKADGERNKPASQRSNPGGRPNFNAKAVNNIVVIPATMAHMSRPPNFLNPSSRSNRRLSLRSVFAKFSLVSIGI